MALPDGSVLAEPRRELGTGGFDPAEAARAYGDPPTRGQLSAYASLAGVSTERVIALLRFQASRGVVPPSWTELATFLAGLTAEEGSGPPPA